MSLQALLQKESFKGKRMNDLHEEDYTGQNGEICFISYVNNDFFW